MRRNTSRLFTNFLSRHLVLRFAYALALICQCSAEGDICEGTPRTLFTLNANITQRAFEDEARSIRKSGYLIVLEMPELQMIVGCFPGLNPSISQVPRPVPHMTRSGITGIENDGVVNTAGKRISWALDRIDQPRLPLDRYHFDPRNCSERLGSDVDVFIIDTGCRITHSAFKTRLIRTEPAPGSSYSSGDDNNGHGTAVASLVVGRETGAAARANVTCIKALNGGGTGRFSDVIAGLNVAVARRKRGRERRGTFAVLSLTAAADASYTAMDKAVSRAARQGVVTFAAAGNEGRDACRFTPGRNDDAVAVGATDQKDNIAEYSNVGRCVDAVAPGSSVLTASLRDDDSFTRETGTSFSTPLVAGVVALKWGGTDRGGGFGETEGARRLIAGMRNVSAAGFDYRMPTLNGLCHSDNSYKTMKWGLLTTACVGAGAVVFVGIVVAKWWLWYRPWVNSR